MVVAGATADHIKVLIPDTFSGPTVNDDSPVVLQHVVGLCGTLKCENAAICEKVAKCEQFSTLNVKIDAICEKITLNVKKLGSLNVSNISTLNVLKSTLYVQTLF